MSSRFWRGSTMRDKWLSLAPKTGWQPQIYLGLLRRSLPNEFGSATQNIISRDSDFGELDPAKAGLVDVSRTGGTPECGGCNLKFIWG